MRILLAEDEPELRSVVGRMLGHMGHLVEAVENGQELVRRAGEGRADVVVSDIDMPGCDGIRAGRLLRSVRPGLIMVLMTGDPDLAREARDQGFPRVLLKPFSADELAAALPSF